MGKRFSDAFGLLKYSFLMIVIWSLWLLVFWPGIMSNDSIDQWTQITTGKFVDIHPVFHTLFLWFLTRVYFSPATIAIVQILILSLLSGGILYYFEKLGSPKIILWGISFFMAVSPVNAEMVITLWKDIPYSTALLGLTFIFLIIVYSNGNWLYQNKNLLLLGITTLLVFLFRHNGGGYR